MDGNLHANNTILDVKDIGNTNCEALLCLTNARSCCGNNYGNQGGWYLPSELPVKGSNSMHWSRNRGPSVLRLISRATLNDSLSPMGVFRCEIPDASGVSQNLYIGIYPSGVGVPVINKLPEYSYNTNQMLTCTSTGGPATNVEWLKDGQILGHEYEQQKRIVNQTTAEYQSILSLGQLTPDEIIGKYTCRVTNARGGTNETIHLHGS